MFRLSCNSVVPHLQAEGLLANDCPHQPSVLFCAPSCPAASYVVANMVFLAGVFSFAAVIGIVSDEIKTGIKNSRAGNYNMRLDGHIVLLNWNSGSTALLRHIASAYAVSCLGMCGKKKQACSTTAELQ